ncbi:type II toxin-antitoxin system VapC family toxin [bacterium]|nr:type II toxin-antitoxin system VapC family toxin [bacterium]
MILIDANLLLYAYNPQSEYHERAKQWLEETFSQTEPVRLGWQSILAFLRIVTNVHVFKKPFTPREARGIVSHWLAQPSVAVLEPGERHWEILGELLEDAQIRGPLVTDAHLAALAIEHGMTLCSHDSDFLRFTGLKFQDPLRISPDDQNP